MCYECLTANRCEAVPAVNNAIVDISTIQLRVGTAKCLPGHLFSSGYAIKTFECGHDGTWDAVGACEGEWCHGHGVNVVSE